MSQKDTVGLIDRYLFAVGELLPRAQRSDITRELRTLIEDKLEEHARAGGQSTNAALAAAVLQEIGEPAVVAQRYDPKPQYLIGPRFYPAFLRIVKIGLAAVAGAVVLTTLLSQASTSGGAAAGFTGAALLSMLGRYFQIAMSLFAWVVLVLAILERTQSRRPPPSRPWDARDLPAVPHAGEDRVSAPGLAVEISLVFFVLVVVNFIPQWVGVLMVPDGRPPEFMPLTEFGVQLPLLAINLWLAVALALKFAVLGQRRWTTPTRWLEVAVGLLAAGVVFLIAVRSTWHGPAGLPQLDAPLRLLGRLLYLAPFAVLIQPVRRIIRLIRALRPEAAGVP